jgi:hypothetical protein
MKALTFLNSTILLPGESTEKRIARRQLSIKDVDSASWFIEMKKILIKYDLPDIIQLLDNPHKKEKWKTLVYRHVYRYWQDEIINISNYYRFLTYLNPDIYTPGKIRPLLQIPIISSRELNRIAIKLKVMSSAYVLLQSNRANFNKNKVDPTCMICGLDAEDIEHFVLNCCLLENQ